MIDYSKPTAQMLGRWQPFHDGHCALFKEILKKTGQVLIMVRTLPKSKDNPYEFEEIKKRIENHYIEVYTNNLLKNIKK